jgi:hypothetical protein
MSKQVSQHSTQVGGEVGVEDSKPVDRTRRE